MSFRMEEGYLTWEEKLRGHHFQGRRQFCINNNLFPDETTPELSVVVKIIIVEDSLSSFKWALCST